MQVLFIACIFYRFEVSKYLLKEILDFLD